VHCCGAEGKRVWRGLSRILMWIFSKWVQDKNVKDARYLAIFWA
jgi:hypothetical protein